jgi:hypothetical protein
MHPMHSQFRSLWGDHVRLDCFCRTLARTLIFLFLFFLLFFSRQKDQQLADDESIQKRQIEFARGYAVS